MSAAPAPGPQITPPGQEKFTVPVRPPVNVVDALFSILSLLAFAGASVLAATDADGWPWWAVLPFWCTAAGSAVGCAYETVLFLTNRPYQLFDTAAGRFVQALRFGNLAPVFGSTYLAFALVSYGSTEQAGWLVFTIGGATGYLLVLFLFRGPPLAGLLALAVGLVAQLVLVWTGPDLRGGEQVRWLLTNAAVALFATTLIGAQTPLRSTIFHVFGLAVVGLLYSAWDTEFGAARGARVARPHDWLWLLAAGPAGAWLAFRLYPTTWALLRSLLANLIWPLFYLVIAGGARVDSPRRLSELYKGREKKLAGLTLHPYYVAHPRNLTHKVSVPALDDALTVKLLGIGFLLGLVKLVFGLASALNRFFPFANVAVPLAHKPRMLPHSDGTEYWPRWLLRQVYLPRLGWFKLEAGVKGPGFQKTPLAAVEAYRNGQLLAYLVEYGIAGAFVRAAPGAGRGPLALDFAFLEKYETKPDYESYGGAAYFEIDAENRLVRLTHVRAPHSTELIAANPNDPTFRRAEDLVLASVYFYVVSGKHLVEIHMGLNLIEVALVNAFDAHGQWAHPVRLALYPHLFAHELAEELTTQNLLEDGAIFPQIFATTNAALMCHLNDRFAEYRVGDDEDFDRRERALLTGAPPGAKLEDVLPRCALVWEKKYAALWQGYADKLIGAAYADDAAVAADARAGAFYAQVSGSFPCPLPARYEKFATRAGLARFVADTLHHLIIRHEVYGTSGVRLALDPRINKVQVPKDGGPYAVDEWRALACVAMATSRVRYTHLLTPFAHVFDDLTDDRVRAAYKAAHDALRSDLLALQSQFLADGINNDETLRLLPRDLEIGAGY